MAIGRPKTTTFTPFFWVIDPLARRLILKGLSEQQRWRYTLEFVKKYRPRERFLAYRPLPNYITPSLIERWQRSPEYAMQRAEQERKFIEGQKRIAMSVRMEQEEQQRCG